MEFPAVAGPAGQPEVTAKNFLKAHGKLFGILSPAVDFKLRKKNRSPGKHSIRLTQTYNGIPVFGGEMVMQVNEAGGVEYVAGNFDRDTGNLDEKRLATTPTLLAAEASAAAQAHYAPQAPGQVLAVTPPELTLFVPALLKLAGPKRLTWKLEVQSADEHTVSRRVFIDAHSGEFVQDIPLIHDALSRNISDGNFTAAIPGTIVRTEGAAPSENEEADAAYDFLGDTYNFFFTHFQRDGITNNGAALNATVRHREDPNVPFSNAYWSPFLSRMVFGEGFVVDDVTAHEMTHGVTAAESDLIYMNESGAINESISDVFGEFVDLTNGRGDDSAPVRWLIAEDFSGGAFRSMSNPTAFNNNPDWFGSSLYYTGDADQGGVHINSGVNNKLCYLLTDGATFRNITITGMGIDPVAALYHEANVNLLTSSSGWISLASALKQAAINLNWSASQRENLSKALAAIGIGVYVDENFTGGLEAGAPVAPAKSISTGLLLVAVSPESNLFLRGTGHSSRIASHVTIRAWDGPARIVAP